VQVARLLEKVPHLGAVVVDVKRPVQLQRAPVGCFERHHAGRVNRLAVERST
jgi:hypothetical protein